jgi:hypothetical protein
MRLLLLLVGYLATQPDHAVALSNGAALTPPMGWLSWSRFRNYKDCDSDPENCLSEKLLKVVADRMVADGYRDAGYTAINLDSGWWDGTNPRDSAGHLQADPKRFPSGIPALAKYMSERGLQLGTQVSCMFTSLFTSRVFGALEVGFVRMAKATDLLHRADGPTSLCSNVDAGTISPKIRPKSDPNCPC